MLLVIYRFGGFGHQFLSCFVARNHYSYISSFFPSTKNITNFCEIYEILKLALGI